MSIPFVQAKWFTKGAMIEARAILWHMAEGYGTVGYFTRTSRNVSSHYVIERTGRVVQMVRLTDASHSAHVQYDLDDNDAADYGIYDLDIGKAVIGPGWPDINRYAIAVEVEGYRANGPNEDQARSIALLTGMLQAEVPTLRGAIGHRDVQDYKSCPGGKFPWARAGGHGLWAPDTDTEGSVAYSIAAGGLRLASSHVLKLTKGVVLYDAPAKPIKTYDGPDVWVDYYGNPRDVDGYGVVEITTGYGYTDGQARTTLVLVRDEQTVGSIRAKTEAELAATAAQFAECPPQDCSEEVAAAIAADRAKARIVYS